MYAKHIFSHVFLGGKTQSYHFLYFMVHYKIDLKNIINFPWNVYINLQVGKNIINIEGLDEN